MRNTKSLTQEIWELVNRDPFTIPAFGVVLISIVLVLLVIGIFFPLPQWEIVVLVAALWIILKTIRKPKKGGER